MLLRLSEREREREKRSPPKVRPWAQPHLVPVGDRSRDFVPHLSKIAHHPNRRILSFDRFNLHQPLYMASLQWHWVRTHDTSVTSS
ncbi:hypothetical protein TNCV_2298941 [Trichonephila clavipes]|nr:hypothetical protein TNCV_2298941 [Trichonephila clavipes]